MDGCGQCSRRFIQCSGYRNQLDLVFRDQSEEVAIKARIKHQKCQENQQKNYKKSTVGESTRIATSKGDISSEHGNAILRPREFHHELTAETFIINEKFCTPRVDYLESYSGSDRTRVVRCLNYCQFSPLVSQATLACMD